MGWGYSKMARGFSIVSRQKNIFMISFDDVYSTMYESEEKIAYGGLIRHALRSTSKIRHPAAAKLCL